MTKIKWNEFVEWTNRNGWLTFANGRPRNASQVVLSANIAEPNHIRVQYYWVGWDSEKDGYTRTVAVFKSLRQAAKFARRAAKKMGAKFVSMLH